MKYSLKRFVAYLIVFTLMLPIFPVYAGAVDSKNLIPAGLDPSFDSGIKIGTSNKVDNVYLASGLTNGTGYEYDSLNQCIRFTAPTNAWTNYTLRGFSFEEGKSYVVAYDAKVDNASTTGVACSVELNGTDNATILPSVKNGNKTVMNDWTRVSRLFNCTSDTSSIHVVFRFKTNAEPVLIDNLAVYEINYDTDNLLNSNYSFEFAVPSDGFETSGVAELYNDGSDGCYSLKIPTGVAADGKLSNLFKFTGLSVTEGYNYELSADVKLASAADGVSAYMTAQYTNAIEQTTGGSVSAAPVGADGWTKITKTFPVIAPDEDTLDVGIGLEGLPVEGCDVLVDNVVVKKTTIVDDSEPDDPEPDDPEPDDPEPDNPTPVDPDNLLNSINYGFENDIEYATSAMGFVKRDSSCTIIKTAGSDSLPAQEGNSYATITGRSGTSGGIRVQGAPAPTVGQMYIASVYVRLGEASSEKVTAKIALPGHGQNTVQATVIESPDCELSADGWTKVYRIFKVEPKEGATEPYTNKGFHIDFSTNAAGSGLELHVDNFDVREYIPVALAVTSTTPANNATDVDKSTAVTVTFNNKLSSLDIEQISVSGGAVVEEVSSDGLLTHTIKIKGMRNNNTYTVTLTNLEDTYGGSLASYSFSFTIGERVPLPNLIANPGLENGTTGWKFYPTDHEHWGQASAEHNSGLYSLKWQGDGDGPSCQAYQELPVEKNTKYVFSFYAKISSQAKISLRQGSKENKPEYEGTVTTLSANDQWKRYVMEFDSGDNTMVRLWLRHTSNSTGPNYYDDFVLAKHENAMEVEYSSVKDGDTNVSVNIGKIVLEWTYKIDSKELAGIADKFSIDNGAEISSVDVSADGCTVELNLSGNLKNNTTYTLSYDKITDECGISSEEGTIEFTTKPDFLVISEPVLVGTTATAVVENCTSQTIQKAPILLAAVYNADKTLAFVKTSSFGESLSQFSQLTLSVEGVSVANTQSYKLFIISSADDMTLPTPSVGSGVVLDAQTAKNTSVNPEEQRIEIAGKAVPGEELLVVVLKTSDNIGAYNSYANNTVLPSVTLTEANIDTQCYYVVSVVADDNGEYDIVLPMPVDSSEHVYGVLVGDDSINGPADAVYMPSADVYSTAKSQLLNVTETAFASYMDTYAKAFGISLASPTYSARKNNILTALYGLMPDGGYTNFTKFDAAKTFKKDFYEVLSYYERQDEALAKINVATNEQLSEVLTEYSDVLGDYWQASKLDFNSKYATYGAVNINRQLIGIPYGSMDEFITKFNATTYTPDSGSSVVTPDTPSIGIIGGNGGGGGGASSSNNVTSPVVNNVPASTVKGFSDLADVQWAADSINKLADKGIINGVGNGEFRPHDNVTREQFLKMLMLSLNFSVDNGDGGRNFTDVNANEWYAPYVIAAYNLGIVNGVSDNTFGIGQYISRQDMAVMIYRAAQLAGVELAKVRDITFEDENNISSYALEAVNVLSGAGIINGVSETTFEHYTNTTRAQSAVVLDRIITLKGEN